MIRRLTTLSAAVVAGVLLPASAHAAVTATVRSPGRDAVVSAPVELRVEVERGVLDPAPGRVEVRLSEDGVSAAAGTTSVSLSCLSGCGSTTSTWGGALYDPATAAPFRSTPGCNGRWYLQTSVDGSGFGAGTPLVASAPAAPATNVRVRIDGRTATVTWQRSPEPDVVGYRIERRADGGSWRTVDAVGPRADTFTDRDLLPATYDYRVVTLRPDGRGPDGPLAPCADTSADLATTSAASTGRVTTPPPSPSPSPSSGGGTSSGGTGTTGGTSGGTDAGSGSGSGTPSDGSTSGGATPAGGTDGDGQATGDGGQGTAPRSTTRTRIAPPPSAQGSRLDTDASLPGQPRGEERYYGEDDPFSESLDYGETPQVAPPADADEGVVASDGLGTVELLTGRLVDPERILRPVAGGLVMLTLGLHLRRWSRESHG